MPGSGLPMTKLRLVADDLTGALDSGAQFAGCGRAIPVYLGHGLPESYPAEAAVDSASREADGPSAAAIAAGIAHVLAPAHGTISFKKVDSLLRGNPGIELAAILRAIAAPICVIAPAFPFHGRVTRAGLQHVLRNGSWHRTGEDIGAVLSSHGIAVRFMRPGEPVPEGTSIWDAETDDDLRRIARSGADRREPILWCGSGGLAAALSPSGAPMIPIVRIGRPLLGIFGSDHPGTAAQLLACADDVVELRDFGASDAVLVRQRLEDTGVCHVRAGLAPGIGREEASRRIAAGMNELARRIPPQRSLLVAGGETLRSLCAALGAARLDVTGQLMPGVPVSRMVGGLWDGAEVISKSGAFGGTALIREIAGRRAP
jgi:uncharacterized protein YgbK (DUF1537 family)